MTFTLVDEEGTTSTINSRG